MPSCYRFYYTHKLACSTTKVIMARQGLAQSVQQYPLPTTLAYASAHPLVRCRLPGLTDVDDSTMGRVRQYRDTLQLLQSRVLHVERGSAPVGKAVMLFAHEQYSIIPLRPTWALMLSIERARSRAPSAHHVP